MLALGEAGYREVTLLGQNIDAYGRDLPGAAEDGSGRRAWTFTDLLHYIHDVPGIQRIRFATSHPRCCCRPPSLKRLPQHWEKSTLCPLFERGECRSGILVSCGCPPAAALGLVA